MPEVEAKTNPVEAQYRLLVVDDDAMNVDMLARRLERQGYTVSRASSGPEALAAIQDHTFDLVLLDHNMPEMTGIQTLAHIRESHSAVELPVIMVTAVSESDVTVEALNQGANDYITKPVDFPVTLARIRGQLARRSAELSLRARDQSEVMAARVSNDGVWSWDLRSNVMTFSPRWKDILGYSEAEIENSPTEWLSRIHNGDSNLVQHGLEATIEGAVDRFDNEHRLHHKDGGWRWVRCRGQLVRDEAARPLCLAGTLSDITHIKAADPLTNLPNRSLLLERVGDAISQTNRAPGQTFGLLLLDVDRFKVVNDSLGHLVGDELLVGVAGTLRSLGSKFGVTVARVGGDEFAILLPPPAGAAEIAKIGAAIQQALSKPFRLEGREVFCTLSMGAALGPGDATKIDDLLRDADTAIHRAKALGGGRLEMFDTDMRKRAVARLEFETDMRHALAQHHFEVYYQPKVTLRDNHIYGFEALVRWAHPRFGMICPDQFIPLAEETGLIVPLGYWVMEQACRQLHLWQERFPQDPPLVVSVNVSCRQFRDPDLGANVERILALTGLNPGCLHLEITESALMDDFLSATEVLKKLKLIGVGLKMDDFGTGYSSLSNLCTLPFDAVKIDRSFVSSMQGAGSEIIKTIIRLATALHMSVIAEGVEKPEQAQVLQAMGCQYAQGYYFSRPVDVEETEKLLINRRRDALCCTPEKDPPRPDSGQDLITTLPGAGDTLNTARNSASTAP